MSHDVVSQERDSSREPHPQDLWLSNINLNKPSPSAENISKKLKIFKNMDFSIQFDKATVWDNKYDKIMKIRSKLDFWGRV